MKRRTCPPADGPRSGDDAACAWTCASCYAARSRVEIRIADSSDVASERGSGLKGAASAGGIDGATRLVPEGR